MNTEPFFSNIDSELLKQGSVRDYLGLVPVWSKIARKLEPNLSGAIGSYRGLEAVLFIYYLETEHVPKSLNQANAFRDFFRYMEALIEYYLHHLLEVAPCYGSRLLKGNGRDVEIKFTSVTTVNGLYQFYRGTCRRAGMLSSNWELDDAVVKIIKPICSNYSAGIKNLIHLIEQKVLAKEESIKPEKLFLDKEIANLFDAIFTSNELKAYINKTLYADSELEYYASACASVCSLRAEQGYNSKANLAQHLEAYITANKRNWPYFGALKEIKDTEPFLSLLDDCFQLLQLYDSRKLSELELLLARKNIKQLMQMKATAFQRVVSGNSDYETGRFRLLLDMASMLEGADVKAFLVALLGYHQTIMSRRSAAPMVILDEGNLRVLSKVYISDETILLDSILDNSPWKNGYYINTSASIYKQLKGEK